MIPKIIEEGLSDGLPCRLYQSWRQTRGSLGYPVYRVEFKYNGSWILWYESKELENAKKSFFDISDKNQ